MTDKGKGFFWEHLVLNQLMARLQTREIMTWRDKQGHEVDFIRAPRGQAPVAIEVKWKADAFEPKGMLAFRKLHPQGRNLVVASDLASSYTRTVAGLDVTWVPIGALAEELR